ncbi:hypothetical protein VTN02DRAFT_6824 [Thermoascus thermophilus]
MYPPQPAEGGASSSSSSSSSSSAISPYTLLFHNPETTTTTAAGPSAGTRATLRFHDADTLAAFRNCRRVDLRIERHGDLTATTPAQPLHSFALDTGSSTAMEFELPEKLDLDVSERGIIGRRITLRSRDTTLGTGIVGYN